MTVEITASDAGVLLQAIALTLPAVALYMTVLVELHEDVVRARGLSPDPDSPAFEGPGSVQGKMEHIQHHDFVTLTIAMDGMDFRLATGSFLGLLLAAIALLVSIILGSQVAVLRAYRCSVVDHIVRSVGGRAVVDGIRFDEPLVPGRLIFCDQYAVMWPCTIRTRFSNIIRVVSL